MGPEKKRVVVITGAAKGIGKAIATSFAKKDCIPVIVDFDEVQGELTAAALSSQYQVPALFVKADVSQADDLVQVREKVIEHFGRVDVLVINAGVSYLRTLAEISIAEWQKVLAINLNGSFYTLKAFYQDFLTNHGKIIFITSGSAITGTGGGAHYAASKAGQHGLMRTTAKELGPKGVNVNAIAPRVIQTEILDHLYPDSISREKLLEKIPLRRIGQPEDIANLAVFLASPESQYIHGQIILADGGRTY